jgi:outer membrane protein OmpA-like peptidoglycan-associated protein
MNKFLTMVLVAGIATNAFSQDKPKSLRHEISLNFGVNDYGLATGDGNSSYGMLPSIWDELPYAVGLSYSYHVSPMLSTVLGLDYAVVNGANGVERFLNNAWNPYAGLQFRPFSAEKSVFSGIYLQATAGYGFSQVERRLVSDGTQHVSAKGVNAVTTSATLGYRIPLNHALNLNLYAGVHNVGNDAFDGWDYSNGGDAYLRYGLSLGYALGAKKGDKSLASQTVAELRAGELADFAKKSEVDATTNDLKKSVEKIDERVKKIEQTLPQFLKRSDVDTLIKQAFAERAAKGEKDGDVKAFATIYYRFDRDEIDPQYAKTIEDFMKTQYKPGGKFLLIGYADKKGSKDYNYKLSRDRAEGVKDYLMKKYRIPTGDIKVDVGGVQFTEDEKQYLNRRVDLFMQK